MGEHLIESAVRQRMLAALATVPYMHLHDPGRLYSFVVMRTNLTWAELGCLVPSVEVAKSRSRSWAKKGTFDRLLMQCLQSMAVPDVLHIDSTSIRCCRTATGDPGGGEEAIGFQGSRIKSCIGFTRSLSAIQPGA